MEKLEKASEVMSGIWKAAITATGLCGVGAFVFWSLYKDWLALPIFSKMDKDQTFTIMIMFLILAFVASMTMVIAGIYLKKKHSITSSR